MRQHDATSPEASRLWALFGAGALALNFPLLAVWAFWGERLGGPAGFVVALFAVWGVLIGALAWCMERTPE